MTRGWVESQNQEGKSVDFHSSSMLMKAAKDGPCAWALATVSRELLGVLTPAFHLVLT